MVYTEQMEKMTQAGEQLKAWRLGRNLSLQGAANLLGCHRTFIRKVELGLGRPAITNIPHWEEVTGVPGELWWPIIHELATEKVRAYMERG